MPETNQYSETQNNSFKNLKKRKQKLTKTLNISKLKTTLKTGSLNTNNNNNNNNNTKTLYILKTTERMRGA